MHHNLAQNSSMSPKRKLSVQPKSEAWSVQKSSPTRPPLQQTRKVDDFDASGNLVKSKTRGKKKTQRPGSSLGVEKMKAGLELDTLQINSALKDMLPTFKSLNHRISRSTVSKTEKLLPVPSNEGAVGGLDLKEVADIGLGLQPITSAGEKLITIGGYIISLQSSTREDVTSVVKPRVSTDKDGLEAEIKITGCNPEDIRFEKRYGTLIVIGVANHPLPPTPIERKSIIHDKMAGSHTKELTRSKGLSKPSTNLHQAGPSSAITAVPGPDNLDEIHEIVNIFVPKNVSINQIFISAPDAKGRIFVKGP